ncbi:MAG: hypothetical protein Kow00105_10730 [Phycisphaeraceae bacterium]
MTLGRIAPVFVMSVSGTASEVMDGLQGLLRDPGGRFTGKSAGRHMTLTVCESDRHFWSPWLHLEVVEGADGICLRGRFTPHPSVWTGFAFSYFSLIVVACFAGIWGMSQWMLGDRPTALWVALGCVVLVGLLWWSAQVGQKLAREQMELLRQSVEEVVGIGTTSRGAS